MMPAKTQMQVGETCYVNSPVGKFDEARVVKVARRYVTVLVLRTDCLIQFDTHLAGMPERDKNGSRHLMTVREAELAQARTAARSDLWILEDYVFRTHNIDGLREISALCRSLRDVPPGAEPVADRPNETCPAKKIP